ncbi:hypothetical protein WA026_019814 [Henosepilachna vigintioctopunctata]|uniref:Uncharacterized protein n=1 Tax=Henosepilachna vigintioctopunctata TaxID=420089 RepID=A0AAW1V9H2_9CUCU
MLKAKEEKASRNKDSEEYERLRKEDDRARKEEKNRRLSKIMPGSQPTSPTPSTTPKTESRASFSGVLSKVTTNNVTRGLICTNRVNHSSKISLRERLKLHNSAKDTSKLSLISTKDRDNDQNVPVSSSSRIIDSRQNNILIDETQPSRDEIETNKNNNGSSVSDSVGSVSEEPHWSKLKKAAIMTHDIANITPSTENVKEHPPPSNRKIKSKSIFTGRNKQYRSIDDLSPEYGGLPFYESNETPERRNLKSILKKLSEDALQTPEKKSKETIPQKIDFTEFKKLMRAPTIEGYASPPESCALPGITSVNATDNSISDKNIKEEEIVKEEQDSQKVPENDKDMQIVANKANRVKMIKATLDDEQQYFADILLAIKQVMSAHLQEMQEKFHHRFEKLEEEIKNKEQIINKLRAHIFELEKHTDDSFTDSIETIVGHEPSWEDPTNEEQEELEELSQHPLSPRTTWSPRPCTAENVILNIDSTTDTDSDLGDSSDQAGSESGEFENSSTNWEIELLAAQIRQRRSASLDTNMSKPVRKRFLRGSSDEGYN